MIKSFENKTVIITGASAGVGAACARLFAGHKAKLVLVARGEAALNTIADELRSQCEVLTVVMNVASNEDCLTLLEKAEAAFGAVHVIINNAGMHARGDLKTISPADVAAMVDINMRAPLLLSCAAIPYLLVPVKGPLSMLVRWPAVRRFRVPQPTVPPKPDCAPLAMLWQMSSVTVVSA